MADRLKGGLVSGQVYWMLWLTMQQKKDISSGEGGEVKQKKKKKKLTNGRL